MEAVLWLIKRIYFFDLPGIKPLADPPFNKDTLSLRVAPSVEDERVNTITVNA